VGKVIIGDNCWIGARAIILKDVVLGENCIVAAGAVVTKSFPSGSVIGGIPAVLMRSVQ
jgi:acetyltransferase-like isoleucine patch superfamily enzyme